jgi:hypothetical protein
VIELHIILLDSECNRMLKYRTKNSRFKQVIIIQVRVWNLFWTSSDAESVSPWSLFSCSSLFSPDTFPFDRIGSSQHPVKSVLVSRFLDCTALWGLSLVYNMELHNESPEMCRCAGRIPCVTTQDFVLLPDGGRGLLSPYFTDWRSQLFSLLVFINILLEGKKHCSESSNL